MESHQNTTFRRAILHPPAVDKRAKEKYQREGDVRGDLYRQAKILFNSEPYNKKHFKVTRVVLTYNPMLEAQFTRYVETPYRKPKTYEVEEDEEGEVEEEEERYVAPPEPELLKSGSQSTAAEAKGPMPGAGDALASAEAADVLAAEADQGGSTPTASSPTATGPLSPGSAASPTALTPAERRRMSRMPMQIYETKGTPSKRVDADGFEVVENSEEDNAASAESPMADVLGLRIDVEGGQGDGATSSAVGSGGTPFRPRGFSSVSGAGVGTPAAKGLLVFEARDTHQSKPKIDSRKAQKRQAKQEAALLKPLLLAPIGKDGLEDARSSYRTREEQWVHSAFLQKRLARVADNDVFVMWHGVHPHALSSFMQLGHIDLRFDPSRAQKAQASNAGGGGGGGNAVGQEGVGPMPSTELEGDSQTTTVGPSDSQATVSPGAQSPTFNEPIKGDCRARFFGEGIYFTPNPTYAAKFAAQELFEDAGMASVKAFKAKRFIHCLIAVCVHRVRVNRPRRVLLVLKLRGCEKGVHDHSRTRLLPHCRT